MFIGSYDYTLDTKGRLVIPSKFRSILQDNANLYLTRGFDGCISIYKEEDFSKVIARYQSHSYEKAEVRKTLRSFLDSVVPLQIDAQGRILLTSKILEKYKISSKVHILGALDHFEIWDSECWKKQDEENDDNFEVNAEKIFKDEI